MLSVKRLNKVSRVWDVWKHSPRHLPLPRLGSGAPFINLVIVVFVISLLVHLKLLPQTILFYFDVDLQGYVSMVTTPTK